MPACRQTGNSAYTSPCVRKIYHASFHVYLFLCTALRLFLIVTCMPVGRQVIRHFPIAIGKFRFVCDFCLWLFYKIILASLQLQSKFRQMSVFTKLILSKSPAQNAGLQNLFNKYYFFPITSAILLPRSAGLLTT